MNKIFENWRTYTKEGQVSRKSAAGIKKSIDALTGHGGNEGGNPTGMKKVTDPLQGKKNRRDISAPPGAPGGLEERDIEEKKNKDGKEQGADGKACWDGYKYAGTEDGKDKCVPMEENEYMPGQAVADIEKSFDTGEEYVSPEELQGEEIQDLAAKFNVEATVEVASDGTPAILVWHPDGAVSAYHDGEEMYQDLASRLEMSDDPEAALDEKKKKPCKPSKGKRFAKRVDGKCRSYGQSGQAKSGGDRIRPGTAKGDAYCARSAKIKKCKNPPCANALSRKKWKCRGSKSVAE